MFDDDPRRRAAARGVPRAPSCRSSRARDMPAVQWAKLVMNLNNAINALSGLPLAAELAQRAFRRCLAAAQREALDLLARAKQDVARLTAIPPRWMPRLLDVPDRVFRLLARASSRSIRTRGRRCGTTSRRRRPTEIDYLQGEVVALAERLGTRRADQSRARAARSRSRGRRQAGLHRRRAARGARSVIEERPLLRVDHTRARTARLKQPQFAPRALPVSTVSPGCRVGVTRSHALARVERPATHTRTHLRPLEHNSCKPHGPDRDRTCDLGIKSPLLYQLSYRPRRRVYVPMRRAVARCSAAVRR